MKSINTAHLLFFVFLSTTLGLGSAAAQVTGPEATVDQLTTLHTMADWAHNYIDRLQSQGKTPAGDDIRELEAIEGQLFRYDRIVRQGVGNTGIAQWDVEILADRLAQVWLNLRHTPDNTDLEPTTPEPSPYDAVRSTSIPRGTNIVVELTTWLTSKSARVGDRFSVLVSAPVFVDGRVEIPNGTVMEGLVTAVDPAGRVSDAGNLHLYIDRLRGPQGQIVDLHGLVVGLESGADIKGKGVDAGKTATGAVIGGLLGGLLDGKEGALIGLGVGAGGTLLAQRGKDVYLPQGSQLRVEIQDSFSFAWDW